MTKHRHEEPPCDTSRCATGEEPQAGDVIRHRDAPAGPEMCVEAIGRDILHTLEGVNPATSECALVRRAEEPMADEPIMQFFTYAHLPERLQAVSRPFGELAEHLVKSLPRNDERTVALRKLLESKDAAVRAQLFKNPA